MADESFITLKEYFEKKSSMMESNFSKEMKYINDLLLIRLDALTAVIDSKMAAVDLATKIYKETTDNRLETMNEFRAQLGAQAATFWTRELHEVYDRNKQERECKIDDRISELEKVRYTQGGIASQKALTITTGLSIIALLTALIGLLIKIL